MRWIGVSTIVQFLLAVVFIDSAYGAKPDIAAVQKKVRDKHYKFRVGPNPATQYSLEQLCGLKIPADVSAPKLKAPLPPQELPDSLRLAATGWLYARQKPGRMRLLLGLCRDGRRRKPIPDPKLHDAGSVRTMAGQLHHGRNL